MRANRACRILLFTFFLIGAAQTAGADVLGDFVAGPQAEEPALFAASTGMYGQAITGTCIVTHSVIVNMSNSSNYIPPYAIVGSGAEFSADFDDPFGQHWHETVDFTDDYKVFFRHSSPNPSANIGSGELVRWQLSGFDFEIQDVQVILEPSFSPRYFLSFDADNIYVGFDALAAYSPYNQYGFQIIVVPEPGALGLLAGALWLWRWRIRGR